MPDQERSVNKKLVSAVILIVIILTSFAFYYYGPFGTGTRSTSVNVPHQDTFVYQTPDDADYLDPACDYEVAEYSLSIVPDCTITIIFFVFPLMLLISSTFFYYVNEHAVLFRRFQEFVRGLLTPRFKVSSASRICTQNLDDLATLHFSCYFVYFHDWNRTVECPGVESLANRLLIIHTSSLPNRTI